MPSRKHLVLLPLEVEVNGTFYAMAKWKVVALYLVAGCKLYPLMVVSTLFVLMVDLVLEAGIMNVAFILFIVILKICIPMQLDACW